MIALVLAAAVQFSPAQLQQALETTSVSVKWFSRSQRLLEACGMEKEALGAAGEIRGQLASGDIFVFDPTLKAVNGGSGIYTITAADRPILEGEAIQYETLAKQYDVDCRR